jgi:vitamin B12 transporter
MHAARLKENPSMKSLPIAGLVSLAALGAHAQVPVTPFVKQGFESVVVTATRSLQATPSLRDTIVITRDELESAGALSLGEVLQRRAGVELRATGGPGQPQGIFIRGAGAAQTLVLVDGLRVGSATQGTTSIESIPLEMIERIEIVKGPMSSLYGSEAAGGVIQIFTRSKSVPHFFASAGYGTDNDRRASAGLATSDDTTLVSLAMGVRKVDAPSATNPRNTFSYVPDRDPHENGFATMRVSHRFWQGETLALEAFGSRSRTHFDAGDAAFDDRSDQTLSGVRFSSTSELAPWWASRLTLGHGRDKLDFHGQFPASFETRQDQASWINEFKTYGGSTILGLETVRQTVLPDRRINDATGEEVILYTRSKRDTNSGFIAVNQDIQGQRFEASARRDDDEQFGKRNTGSVSYGWEWPSVTRIALTYARGFRAPTFNDLYLVEFEPFYTPNPDLKPERSSSRELSLRSPAAAPVQWRVTAFDNQFEDLIVANAQTVLNLNRARIRGIDASIEAAWLGVRWRATATAQRPRDDETGRRLQGRAEHFGAVEATRAFGNWTVGASVFASGDRFDSLDEAPSSRLPGYAVVDARVRYAFAKGWTAELTATNLGDRKHESAVGYDAPRRGVFLNVRFESY